MLTANAHSKVASGARDDITRCYISKQAIIQSTKRIIMKKINISNKEEAVELSPKTDITITMSHCATKSIIHALLSTAVILIRDSKYKINIK